MPKLRDTPQQRKDKAFKGALGRCLAESGLTGKAVSEKIGVSNVTISRWKNGEYRKMSLERFASLAQRVGMNGREVCKIIGVPYEEDTQCRS